MISHVIYDHVKAPDIFISSTVIPKNSKQSFSLLYIIVPNKWYNNLNVFCVRLYQFQKAVQLGEKT